MLEDEEIQAVRKLVRQLLEWDGRLKTGAVTIEAHGESSSWVTAHVELRPKAVSTFPQLLAQDDPEEVAAEQEPMDDIAEIVLCLDMVADLLSTLAPHTISGTEYVSRVNKLKKAVSRWVPQG